MREECIELGGLRAVSVRPVDVASRMLVVLLHGFQMEPSALCPFAHSLGIPAWFVFPEAPTEAVPAGRAWWSIDPTQRLEALARGPRDFATKNPPDLGQARDHLRRFVKALRALSEGQPLVLGGFSQGGMLTCDALLRREFEVAAALLLSSSRIAVEQWPTHVPALNQLPVLISHGTQDADLAFDAGVALRDAMVAFGADVTWVPFDGGHEIPLVVWRRIRKWMLTLV
jgi:phospholipase/carboxylesterase